MELIRRNESHFEHALRLTNALKDNEFECIKFTHDNGSVYIDSKTVLDILYDEIVAEEAPFYADAFYAETEAGGWDWLDPKRELD